MSLPKVNTAKFDITLPSGVEVKFRPFLVREQKLILQAIEMQDTNQLNNALDDVLKSCICNEVNIDELPIYDIEYLLLQIRAKSVSEIMEINYICQNIVNDKVINQEAINFDSNIEPVLGQGKCETRLPVKINLSTLELNKPQRPNNVIMFTDTIGVVLKDLQYKAYKQIKQSVTESGLRLISEFVEAIIDGDTIHNTGEDFTQDELCLWLEDLVGNDLDKIDDFIKTMPTFKIEMDLVCPSCGTKEKIKLEGIDDFLV